jgi:hypothetical protein
MGLELERGGKYLGYTFNQRATDKVVGCVWGIGEKKWGGDSVGECWCLGAW